MADPMLMKLPAVAGPIQREAAEIDNVGIGRIDSKAHVIKALGVPSSARRGELGPAGPAVGGLKDAEELERGAILHRRVNRGRGRGGNSEIDPSDNARWTPPGEHRPRRATVG